ncbi:MAG: ABC transporter ATP-binding protein, partial [Demequina sp.]|nr:ABC transporter ATP-binding protein [Demequina sp.]
RDLVRELGAEGKAVLVSSHVLAELDEMVDDAIFMSKGVTLGEAADAEVARARTRWRLVAVEGDLGAALAKASRDFTLEEVPQGTAAVVSVSGDADAAALVAALVGEGIKVARIAPVGSALEQAYLTMETERR